MKIGYLTNHTIFATRDIDKEYDENKNRSLIEKIKIAVQPVFPNIIKGITIVLFIDIAAYTIIHLEHKEFILNAINQIPSLTTIKTTQIIISLFREAIVLLSVVPAAIFSIALSPICSQATFIEFYETAFIAPILEEIIYRLFIQNGIYHMQRFAKWVAPECVNKTAAFDFLTSTSARIILTNTIFTLEHLHNADSPEEVIGSLAQTTRIFLCPTESIVYEKTGSILASITSHAANNALVCTIGLLIEKILLLPAKEP